MTRRPTKGDFLAGIHTEKQTPEQRALMRKEYERVTAKLAADYASGEIRSVLIVSTDKNGRVLGGYHIEADDEHPMLTHLRTILQRCILTWNNEGSLPKLDEIP